MATDTVPKSLVLDEIASLEAALVALKGRIVAYEAPVVVPAPTIPVPLGIPATGYNLVLEDLFDGTALNTAIWGNNWLGAPGAITKPVNSAELAAYDPKQVVVGGGFLNLSAIASSVVAADGKTYAYRSGLVNTYGKKEFTFGIFESRIFMDGNAGEIPWNWGAFWLNGRHNKWPDHIESDIMENLSTGPQPHFHSVTKPNVGFGSKLTNKSGWHIYAEKWTKGRREYWYDGAMVGSITYTDTDYPQYMVLNYGISTQHGGPLKVPAGMKVDYVRVWQSA